MKAGRFINKFMPNLLKREEIRLPLEQANNKKSFLINLSEILQMSYHRYLDKYYNQRGFGAMLAGLLRWSGFVADVTGTYMFWSLGGSGFGFKFLGLILKSIADFFEIRAFRKHVVSLKGKNVRPAHLPLFTEGIIARLAAYMPYGIGELFDLVRGKAKYNNRLNRMAEKQARKAFLISIRKKDSPNKFFKND